MGQSSQRPGLRPFLPADGPVLAEIFQASVEELTGEDYSEGQQEARGCGGGRGLPRQGLTLVATLEGQPVGFILQDNELIDLFYVHPDAAGSARCFTTRSRSSRARAAPSGSWRM